MHSSCPSQLWVWPSVWSCTPWRPKHRWNFTRRHGCCYPHPNTESPPPTSVCSPPVLSPGSDQITTFVVMFKLPTVPTGPTLAISQSMKGMETLLYSCWALRPITGALKFLRGWGTGQVCRFPGTPFKTRVLFKHHGVSRGIRVAGEVPWAGYLCPHPRSAFWASPLEPGDQSMLRVRDP